MFEFPDQPQASVECGCRSAECPNCGPWVLACVKTMNDWAEGMKARTPVTNSVNLVTKPATNLQMKPAESVVKKGCGCGGKAKTEAQKAVIKKRLSG